MTSTKRPLGASITPAGVSFGVWAPTVERVELILDPESTATRIPLAKERRWRSLDGGCRNRCRKPLSVQSR